MSKKIIGLLLALCLVVGLLPMAALAEEPKTVTISILSDCKMTLTEGGEAVYMKNQSYEGFTDAGAANGTGWTQTKTGASENDWNVKGEYPTGGVPTVTLKDAKLDMMGDDGKNLYVKATDPETGDVTYKMSTRPSVSAIIPNSGTVCDLKVVLQGDNQVDVNYGIIRCNVGDNQKFNNVTIVGENGGKLSGMGRTFNLRLNAGYNLTIENATLNFAATGSGGEAIPLATLGGDIIIKNSDITMTSEGQVAISAEGKIIITDSKVNTVSYTKNGATNGSGSINGKQGVVITNSEVTAEGKNHVGIYGGTGGVEINSGKITIISGESGINAGTDADVKINGGTVEITSNTKAFSKTPILAAGIVGIAGATAEFAEAYDGKNYLKPWILLTDTPANLPTVAPTEAPTIAPTVVAPTQAPTKAPTKAPTTAPTQAPAATDANNQTSDNADSNSNNTVLYIAAAAILVIAAAAVVLIVVKRKKA